MMAKELKIQRLRFSDFSDQWLEDRMDSFLVLQRGYDLTKSQSSPGPYPVYSSSGISYYHAAAKVKAPGIVTGQKGSVGHDVFLHKALWNWIIAQRYDAMLDKKRRSPYPKFIAYHVQS